MKKRILLTGGSGLLALNWALANRNNFAVTLGLNRRSISLVGVESVRLDLESLENFSHSLSMLNPDIVIHTAGLTSVERCEDEPELAFHVNAEIAEMVAKVCACKGIPLVHISTDHLFAGTVPLLAEDHPVAPLNLYGKTKAVAEQLVLKVYPDALVVRTNFFAWGTSYRKSFSDFIIGGLRSGKPITLFDDVFYTPILVETLALAVHELLDNKASGIINVVSDDRLSKYEFGMKLAEQFSLDRHLIKMGSISNYPDMIQRPKDMSLSNHKVCNLLGRKLGTINEQVVRLFQQEASGIVREIRTL